MGMADQTFQSGPVI